MWNITNNKDYRDYKFSNKTILKNAELIEMFYVGILDKGFINLKNTAPLFSKLPEILVLTFDMLVLADKSFSEKNAVSTMVLLSAACEYVVKYSLMEIGIHKDNEGKDYEDRFHNFETIEMWKVFEKAKNVLPKFVAKELDIENALKRLNNFKHLNSLNVIYMHYSFVDERFGEDWKRYLSIKRRRVVDVIDETTNFFSIAMFVMFFGGCYEYFTSSDYLDSLEMDEVPEKDSQYFVAPWFESFLHGFPNIKSSCIKDGYVIQKFKE